MIRALFKLSFQIIKRRNMHLPTPIYKSIPLIYLASGITSIIFGDMPFSLIPASLFVFASWMVWKMRKNYRQQPQQNELQNT